MGIFNLDQSHGLTNQQFKPWRHAAGIAKSKTIIVNTIDVDKMKKSIIWATLGAQI